MAQFGLIGLAVMGENLALNVEHQGFSVAVYNRTAEKTDSFISYRAGGKNIVATYSPKELVAALERPRKILLMIKSGAPVDAVIEQLQPLLEEDDIIIDGGNSYYEDTARRSRELQATNINFIGMGVSGGEIGALLGPSLMPGGNKNAYEAVSDPHASIVDLTMTQVVDGDLVKVMSWYDNEWGYVNQMVRTAMSLFKGR